MRADRRADNLCVHTIWIVVVVGGFTLLQFLNTEVFPGFAEGNFVGFLGMSFLFIAGSVLSYTISNYYLQRYRSLKWFKELSTKYGENVAKKARDEISHYTPILCKIFHQVGGERLMQTNNLRYEGGISWSAMLQEDRGKQWIESTKEARTVVHHYKITVTAEFEFPEAKIKNFCILGGHPDDIRKPYEIRTSGTSVEELAKTMSKVLETGPLLEQKIY